MSKPRTSLSVISLVFVCLSLAISACQAQVSSPVPSLEPTNSPVLPPPPVTVASATANPATATSALPAATLAPSSTSKPAATPVATPFPSLAAAPEWKRLASGLERPTGIADPGDGSGRLLVLEQPGRIRVYQNGAILDRPFLDITSRVGSSGNEQGLLGIALHPKYLSNGFFYVNYTDVNGNTVIARFKVTSDPNVADPGSEKDLLHVQQPFPNHNGGSMVFGPDGLLYMGLGDGGSQGDPHLNGQSLNTYLGKILRIDVDHGDPYAIPADNPFAKGGGLPEIWAYGLRNPWRFSFDRQTGDMYIADVGQDTYEEINFLPKGSQGGVDFGWSYREGLHPYKGNPPASAKLTNPVFEYAHSVGGCSVTGGYVYRGKLDPQLDGTYIYGDYCTGLVWGLKRNSAGAWENHQLFATRLNISSFGEDQNGELYMLDLKDGGVYRLG